VAAAAPRPHSAKRNRTLNDLHLDCVPAAHHNNNAPRLTTSTTAGAQPRPACASCYGLRSRPTHIEPASQPGMRTGGHWLLLAAGSTATPGGRTAKQWHATATPHLPPPTHPASALAYFHSTALAPCLD